MLALTYTKQATKDLRWIPKEDRERVRCRLDAYAGAPAAGGHDVVPLEGVVGAFRLRCGDWRALFTVRGDVMEVYRIRHRRESYR